LQGQAELLAQREHRGRVIQQQPALALAGDQVAVVGQQEVPVDPARQQPEGEAYRLARRLWIKRLLDG
jgi:hypothetical protein